MNLNLFGWDPSRDSESASAANGNLVAGRVISSAREIYTVVTDEGEFRAELPGAFRYRAVSSEDFPVVGDFLLLNRENDLLIVNSIMKRKSTLKRKAPGTTSDEQILAANIDYVFIVLGLDGGRSFNLRTIERMLTLVWDGGASPVVILNKADLCEDPGFYRDQASSAAPGVPVLLTSANTGEGIDQLQVYFSSGKTGLFIGRSGVGKSALTNVLMGNDIRQTGEVRGDDRKGRHTTTSRNLFLLPSGGMLIDSPGIREIQLTGEMSSLSGVFSDVEEFSVDCRFNDCTHSGEPGCAVTAAIENGELPEERLRSYRKHLNELRYQQRRGDARLEQLERDKWKAIHKEYKNFGRKKH